MNSLTSTCGQQRVLRQGHLTIMPASQQPCLASTTLKIRLGKGLSAVSSPASVPSSADRYTQLAADCLVNGNGLARRVLSDPSIEGDPLAFLKATEAYWKAMRQQKHEPHKKGPTVVTTSNASFISHISQPAESNSSPAHDGMSSSISTASSSSRLDYDVVMCGGTLGLMVALALQRQGLRVAVVEKRLAQGRTQEWNTSRHECQVLVDLGLLTRAELDSTVVSEFNPVRCGFKGGEALWVNDCLNIGVSPKALIALLRKKFEALGGVVMEYTMFKSAVVCPDGVAVTVSKAAEAPADIGDANRPNALQQQQQSGVMQHQYVSSQPANGAGRQSSAGHSRQFHSSQGLKSSSQQKGVLSCRLLLDCMGHYSPIVKQIRGRAKPQGMVLVVGGCATGFPAELNQHADLLYTMTDASADMQLFWEAFPAEGGSARTTYMFAYTDAHPDRPSFEKLLDTYFQLMPAYQNLPGLEGLKFKRVLFGGFPCYGSSPLQPGFDRILQLGDASASQSPLSFGGFGCMLRHLPRFSAAISHSLRADRLSRSDLSWIHAYQPSLSAAWLFQRSMSVGVGQLQQQQQQQGQQPESKAGMQDSSSVSSNSNVTAQSKHSSSHASAGGTVQSNIVPVQIGSHVAKVVHSNEGSTSSSRTAQHSNGVVQDGVFSRWAHQLQQPLVAVNTANSSSSSMGSMSAHVSASSSNTGKQHNSPGSEFSSYSQPRLAPGSQTSSNSKSSSSNSNGSSSSGCSRKPSWLDQLLLLPSNHVNALLAANFSVMAVLGQRVLKPFLQDTLKLGPLAVTMCGMMLVKPLVVSRVLCQVGARVLFGWFGHFAALAVYTLAHKLLSPLRKISDNYTLHRLLDILEFGSSSDYRYSHSKPVSSDVRKQLEQAQLGAAAKLAAAAAAGEEQHIWQREQQQQQQQLRHRSRAGRLQQQQQEEVAASVQDLAPMAAAATAGLVPAA